MAYNENLASRVTKLLARNPKIIEKKMFGGIGFLLDGNMACGINGDDLIVRVGPKNYEQTLAEPHTRVFDMTGRPMTGWVVVKPGGLGEDVELEAWVNRGITFAKTLPPK